MTLSQGKGLRVGRDRVVTPGVEDVRGGAELVRSYWDSLSCPIDGAALALDGAGEGGESDGLHVIEPAAVRLT